MDVEDGRAVAGGALLSSHSTAPPLSPSPFPSPAAAAYPALLEEAAAALPGYSDHDLHPHHHDESGSAAEIKRRRRTTKQEQAILEALFAEVSVRSS